VLLIAEKVQRMKTYLEYCCYGMAKAMGKEGEDRGGGGWV